MKYTSNRYPDATEVCAVCHISFHKAATLLFDRVYVGPSAEERPGFDTPIEVTFGFREADLQIIPCFDDLIKDIGLVETLAEKMRVYTNRAISQAYRQYNCSVIPLYESYRLFGEEFAGSAEIAYEGALQNIDIVDHEKLEWDQVLEFRRDKEAARKYRDLRMWLQRGLEAKSVAEATDIIASKLDAYEWSIRKHGIETIKGALTFVLDYKQAGVSAAAAALGAALGGPILATLTSGLVLSGQVCAWAMERMIAGEEVKRGDGCEVALIYDINKRFSKS